MLRKSMFMVVIVLLALVSALPAAADPGKPSFGPALYGDGDVWGTKAVTVLPTPNGNNLHSFDKLFVILNSNNPEGQLAVSEAAPGNPDFNGGRWYTHTVEWTDAGFAAHGIVPVLKSYDDIKLHESLGHLAITAGTFEGGPPAFFLCPLLPVK